jgi:hypothetical protein
MKNIVIPDRGQAYWPFNIVPMLPGPSEAKAEA